MKEHLTTVTRKGQVTIPIDIRRRLRINEGDRVAFSIIEGDEDVIIIRPVHSIAEMTYGMAAALSPVSDIGATDVRNLRERFETDVAEKVMDSLSGRHE